MIPCEAGQTDVITQILEDMSEDIKNSMPGKKLANNNKAQASTQKTSGRLYEDFDLMRYLYQQWMSNRRGIHRQGFPWPAPFMPFYRAPKMLRMDEWMSDMRAVMSEMKNLEPVMKNLLPTPQSMMEKMTAGRQNLLPWIDEQSVQTMIDMNQIGLEMNQWRIDHRIQIDDNVFKMLMMILGLQPEA